MPLQRLDLTPRPHPLGEAIGQGLENLASQKMSQLQRSFQQQNTARGLEALGFSQPQAKAYASLDPALLQMVVKDKLENQPFSNFGMFAGGQLNNQYDMPSYNQPTNEVPSQPSYEPKPLTEDEILGSKIFGNIKRMSDVPLSNQPNIPGSPPKNIAPQQPQSIQQKPIIIPPGLTKKQAVQFVQQAAKDRETQRKEGVRAAAEEKRATLKNISEANKETKPYYDEVVKKHDLNQKTRLRLQRIEDIINSPSGLPSPAAYKILKDLEDNISPSTAATALSAAGGALGGLLGAAGGGVSAGPLGAIAGQLGGRAAGVALGGAIGGLSGLLLKPMVTAMRYAQKNAYPNIDEFDKLTSSFLEGAKAIFGARITDKDLEYFFNTIPTLATTEAGRKAIMKNMQLIIDADDAHYKAMEEIIAENNGNRPRDLAIQVNKRSEPIIAALTEEFRRGMAEADQLYNQRAKNTNPTNKFKPILAGFRPRSLSAQ